MEQEDNTPKIYKRNDKEIDLLWQNFKNNAKEERSPGIYLLTGFIAGVLSMFVMNSIASISSNVFVAESNQQVMGQPKVEKQISKKETLPQISVNKEGNRQENTQVKEIAKETEQENVVPVATQTYTVQNGDSMSTIVHKFYGKYDVDKIEKIKQINNLKSINRLSIGQEIIIPKD